MKIPQRLGSYQQDMLLHLAEHGIWVSGANLNGNPNTSTMVKGLVKRGLLDEPKPGRFVLSYKGRCCVGLRAGRYQIIDIMGTGTGPPCPRPDRPVSLVKSDAPEPEVEERPEPSAAPRFVATRPNVSLQSPLGPSTGSFRQRIDRVHADLNRLQGGTLGVRQAQLMQALAENGDWTPECEWLIDNHSTTFRLANGLVARGLVSERKDGGFGLSPTGRLRMGMSPRGILGIIDDAMGQDS